MTTEHGIIPLICHGEALQLHPERALYWPLHRTLIIADLHAGKGTVLRRGGLAIPSGSSNHDLQRLTRLIQSTGAERLLILGDVFHGRLHPEEPFMVAFRGFSQRHTELAIQAVPGNHDRHSRYADLDGGLSWLAPDHAEPPFVFRHEPMPHPSGYVWAGHLHPAVRLQGRGDRLQLAVFWLRSAYGVLPAFGSLTGSVAVVPRVGDQLYAVTPDGVVAVATEQR